MIIYRAIRLKTNNAFVNDVPVSPSFKLNAKYLYVQKNPYPQFLRIQRVWRALTMLKWSGQAHGIDRCLPLRRPGSVGRTVLCLPGTGFQCPR